MIPLERFAESESEVDGFLNGVFSRWDDEGKGVDSRTQLRLSKSFRGLAMALGINESYQGTLKQRLSLRSFTSGLIGRYIRATRLSEDSAKPLTVQRNAEDEIRMLKELTRHYVIKNPALATQQEGFRRVVRTLFGVFADAVHSTENDWIVLPARYQAELRRLTEKFGTIPLEVRIRTVADAIAGLSDMEAVRLYQRLTGIAPGSIHELKIT